LTSPHARAISAAPRLFWSAAPWRRFYNCEPPHQTAIPLRSVTQARSLQYFSALWHSPDCAFGYLRFLDFSSLRPSARLSAPPRFNWISVGPTQWLHAAKHPRFKKNGFQVGSAQRGWAPKHPGSTWTRRRGKSAEERGEGFVWIWGIQFCLLALKGPGNPDNMKPERPPPEPGPLLL